MDRSFFGCCLLPALLVGGVVAFWVSWLLGLVLFLAMLATLGHWYAKQ